jgi:predicted DNA-binding transcriptional regulator YafY
MKIISKERRQVELFSIIQTSKTALSIADLCASFDVEVATIQRDLRELRKRGIPIHSVRKGVQLLGKLDLKTYQQILSLYLASVGNVISYPKNISLTVRKLYGKSIDLFVALVNAIESRHVVRLTYYKMFDDDTVIREIEPYDLIPTSRDWRLIAKSDVYYKQFLIENIENIETLEKKFQRVKEYDSTDFFKNTFNYWRGSSEFDVVCRFSKKVAPIIKAEVWAEDQEIIQQKDGSIILKMKVNSLEQVGDWLMGWGGEVKVIYPTKLRKHLITKAQRIIGINSRIEWVNNGK